MRAAVKRRAGRPGFAVAAWCLVVLAAGLEVIWALALTEADGLARPGWAVAGVVIAITSLVILTLALRRLPLGSAYTVWVGIGAVGVSLAGALALGEALTPLRIACLALIVGGVIGLTRTEAAPNPDRGKEIGERAHPGAGPR